MQVRKNRQGKRAAFTLTEVLIVVAIIVILAGISATILVPQFEKGKEGVAKSQAVSLAAEVEKYYINHGEYPGELSVLAQPDPELNNSPYVPPETLLDPWKHPFQLDASGPKPVVWTQHGTKRISNIGGN